MNKKLLLATPMASALILMSLLYAAHSRLTEAAPLPPYLSEPAPPLQVAEPTRPSDQAQFPPWSIAPTPTPRPTQPSLPTTLGSVKCTPNALIILQAQDVVEMQHAISTVEERGGCVVHVFPTRALIGFVPTDMALQLIGASGIANIHRTWVAEDDLASQGAEVQQAIYIWNRNYVNPAPPPTLDPGAPRPRPLVGDVLQVEPPPDQASRRLRGPGYYQTSEYMAGKVAVGIILPESNGATDPSTENWSSSRTNQVIAKIQAGLNWWASVNSNGHLSFYYDIHQVPTRYEPINRSSGEDGLWISDTLTYLGYSGDSWYSKVYAYLNTIRANYGTDWAVVAYVVDSLNDPDGVFTNGYFGYTYGFLIVMTYDNDGWGIGNMDSVTAHEFAHDFGAGDEYCSPGYACCWGGGQYGYLGIPNSNCEAGCDHNSNGMCDGNDSDLNSNCHNCPSCVETTCLMRQGSVSSGVDVVSQHQMGIRDSDGDGILDPVDTIPIVALDAWPPELVTDTTPSYAGMAQDIPYTSPTRSSVSINNIVSVMFELDYDGIWRPGTAVDGAFNNTTESFALTTPLLSQGTHSILIRAINRAGNESAWLYDTFTVDSLSPTTTLSASPLYGDAPFLDCLVQWSGQDATSGVASFDVQYRDGASGSWTNWLVDTTRTDERFVGQDGHTYYFRARARDYAGNVGSYTDGNAAYTVQICSTPPDAFEADNTSAGARWITTDGISQSHTFHAASDQDWVKFYAAAGVTYTLTTTNTGGHADTVLYLYSIDGSTLINSNDDYPGMWPSSRLDWQPTASNVYYAMVNHWDVYAYGCTTRYGLAIVTNDVISPTGSIAIYGGATTSTTVMLNLASADVGTGVDQMMIANNSSFSGAIWRAFAASLNWTLTAIDGVKSVYVKYRDRAGNVSAVYSDTVILDTTAPTGSITIQGGASVVTNTQVILTLGASDVNGVTKMRLRSGAGSWGAWELFATSRLWTLPSVPGVYTIWAQFRDVVGNESAPYSDSIEYQFPYRVHLPGVMRDHNK